MSAQAVAWALRQKTGSPSAKSVLLALANYAGPDGACYPSQQRLAEDTEQSVDSVQRRLVELERLGFVFRQHRQGKRGWRRSDEFVVLMDDHARACAAAMGWAPHLGESARETLIDGRHVDSNAADCGHDPTPQSAATPRPQIADSNTADEGPPKPHWCGTEPKHKPKHESPPQPPQGGSMEVDDSDDRWERFSKAWVFDDPTDRQEPAKKAFVRMMLDEQLAAIAAAPRYRDQCRLRARKMCHAKTWLADKGWQSFANPAPAAGQQSPSIFIEAGSPQAAAWSRYTFETTGKRMFMTEMNAPGGGRKVGRYEHSEWPPRRQRDDDGVHSAVGASQRDHHAFAKSDISDFGHGEQVTA